MAVLWGLDVSRWQGQPDWDIARSRADFVFVKATQGTGLVDREFERNRLNLDRLGVPWGAYHFADVRADPIESAQHHLSTVGGPSPLPDVLDIERAHGRNGDYIGRWCLTWLDTVSRETGRRPLIYSSPSFLTDRVKQFPRLGDFPLWIAHWNVSAPTVPAPWTDFTIWQFTNRGQVDGIPANAVDLNRTSTARFGRITAAPIATPETVPASVPDVGNELADICQQLTQIAVRLCDLSEQT